MKTKYCTLNRRRAPTQLQLIKGWGTGSQQPEAEVEAADDSEGED